MNIHAIRFLGQCQVQENVQKLNKQTYDALTALTAKNADEIAGWSDALKMEFSIEERPVSYDLAKSAPNWSPKQWVYIVGKTFGLFSEKPDQILWVKIRQGYNTCGFDCDIKEPVEQFFEKAMRQARTWQESFSAKK